MQRKKKSFKVSSGDEEEWIMSYADTVTLLLCFFVIFFSQSNLSGEDEDKQEQKHVKLISEIKKERASLEVEQARQQKKIKTLQRLKDQLIAEFKSQNLRGVEVRQRDSEVIVRLSEKEFFNVGSFKLIRSGKASLVQIASSLENVSDDFEVYIEGHTDSKPVRGSLHYKSNLGLSSLRASAAAEILLSSGLDKERVRVVGYGASRPLVKDRVIATDTKKVTYLEEQSKRNRRVEVRVVYEDSHL